MHATLMHCDRKPLTFYRTVQVGQVLTFSYALSICTVLSIHTLAGSPHQETPTSPSLQYCYHFLHLQQTLNSFTEHHSAVVDLRRKIWAEAAVLSIEGLQGCCGSSRVGRLASFIHRQSHPSTSLAAVETGSFHLFSLGATNVKKNQNPEPSESIYWLNSLCSLHPPTGTLLGQVGDAGQTMA